MKRLTKEQVLLLHDQLIEVTGGKNGIRDEGMLESALEAPFQAFGDVEIYPTLEEKAARLGYGLIMNHSMIDGNKRIGTHVMLVFLRLNGIKLNHTQKELSELIWSLAAGNVTCEQLCEWITAHEQK